MNGDTIERIARFLEREDASLPERVTNHMILIALREERDDRRRENGRLARKVEALTRLLEGLPGEEGGLIGRLDRVERFRKVVMWALSAVTLAFLGGIGSWLLGLFVN